MGICNSLAPEITKAATKAQEEVGKDKLRYGACNSRVYREIAEAFDIGSYPWVASFYKGKKLEEWQEWEAGNRFITGEKTNTKTTTTASQASRTLSSRTKSRAKVKMMPKKTNCNLRHDSIDIKA